MASVQYLQALGAMRDMQQQTVSRALKRQSSSRLAMTRPSTLQSMRPMESRPEREMMGDQSGLMLASGATKQIASGLAISAGLLASNYISNIGNLTGNKAAENATKNTLAKGGFALATGFGAFKAAQAGLAVAGPVGAAIGAAGALALAAMLQATENEKLIMRLENRQAQSNKDSQRLGYITYSRGR